MKITHSIPIEQVDESLERAFATAVADFLPRIEQERKCLTGDYEDNPNVQVELERQWMLVDLSGRYYHYRFTCSATLLPRS